MFDRKQLTGLRERLRKGQLSQDDYKVLDDLLDGAEQIASLGEGEGTGGKRVVARLPFGMDVVK